MPDTPDRDNTLLQLSGRLFAAVTILESLPTIKKKIEFSRRALADIPGMPLETICVRSGIAQDLAPDRLNPVCDACRARTPDPRFDFFECRQPEHHEELGAYFLGTANLLLGHVLFFGTDAADAPRIEPLVLNFITALAVSIENDLQKEAIYKSKRTLHAIFDATDDAITLISRDGVIQSINLTAADRFGKSPEDLVGASVFSLMTGEDAAALSALLAEVDAAQEPACVATQKDEGHFETKAYPIFDAKAALTGYAVFSTDITAHKQSEAALRYHGALKTLILDISSRFINLPFDAIDDGIETALEQIAGFLRADSGYLFRFSDDLKTFSLTHLWHNDNLLSNKERLTGLDVQSMSWWMDQLKKGDPVVAPAADRLPDAAAVEKEIIMSQGIRSIADAPLFYQNRLIGFLGFASATPDREWTGDEISLLLVIGQIIINALQRKAAESKLHQAHERLEQKVRERTEALEKKARQLEAANQELDQFAYVASHDLKAPLRAIHNYSDFLREDLEDALEGEQRAYLDNLGRAVRQGEELVNDLLALSRLGRLNEKCETLNLGDIVKNVLHDAGFDDGVRVILPERWPEVTAPPTLIRLIFQNLVSNAVKFNLSQPKVIDIGWGPADGNGVCAWVKDNGIGIDARFHDQIFKLFQRLHTRKDYDGSGLGLAIVRKAASILRGSVAVSSTPGKGAAFTVTIPKPEQERSP